MSEWAVIEGFLGRYAVSDAGEVLSMNFRQSGLPGLLRPNVIRGGYLQVKLGGKCFLVHRLVAAAFIGPCPEGFEVNHKDGRPANCRASNLEYLTHSGNMLHAFETGLAKPLSGARNPAAKLTQTQVAQARLMLASGIRPQEIATFLGVARRTISAIKTGQNWQGEPTMQLNVETNMDAAGESLTAQV